VDIPMGVTGLLGEGGLYQCRIRLPSYEILSMALSLSLCTRKISSFPKSPQKLLRKTSKNNERPSVRIEPPIRKFKEDIFPDTMQ